MVCFHVFGWVNLIGEYIDYVGGFVFLVVIDCGVILVCGLVDRIRLWSDVDFV